MIDDNTDAAGCGAQQYPVQVIAHSVTLFQDRGQDVPGCAAVCATSLLVSS